MKNGYDYLGYGENDRRATFLGLGGRLDVGQLDDFRAPSAVFGRSIDFIRCIIGPMSLEGSIAWQGYAMQVQDASLDRWQVMRSERLR